MLETILRNFRRIIPKSLYKEAQPMYHFLLAFAGKTLYRFPSKYIKVIGITGTKGKSSTTEYVNAILEAAGYKTSILSTIRFKVGGNSRKNLYKMTMPGRLFTQKFLRESVNSGCDYAIIEMTSEGARFYRNHGVHMDGLIVTNISPEHIESHGSFENYLNAKLSIAKSLEKSCKKNKVIVVNMSSPNTEKFLDINVDKKIKVDTTDLSNVDISLPGEFNKANAKLAVELCKSFGVGEDVCMTAIKNLKSIAGRAEEVTVNDGGLSNKQNFKVVVDYAHTVDSLEKIYSAYPGVRITVIGATGGGRDKWKQPQLGKTADDNCKVVIVTDEDPYDDNVMEIINNVASGVKNKIVNETLFIESDRRKAIALGIKIANEISKDSQENVSVIISGKGTDPYIMRAKGNKEKWSDREVAEEELGKLLLNTK